MNAAAAERILEDLESSGIRLGLETERRILTALGDPQRSYGSVLVAGTNGKGSTAALLASMATAAGYRTGLYTSPHLERPNERIRVDGVAVGDEELARALSEVVSIARREAGSPPTHFEALTAAAFGLFRDRGVELAVLEVGLGGRLDATNVVDPVLSAITEIGLDHRDYLGATLREIAREKAGILRPGGLAMVACPPGDAFDEIEAVSRQLGAELHPVAAEVEMTVADGRSWDGQEVAVKTPVDEYELRARLLGEHQARNLAHAVRCAEALHRSGWAGLEKGAIVEGAGRCRWPGRLERVPLPDGRGVLLDVAHNAAAAAALAAFIDERALRFDLLFGALADKDAEAFLPPLVRRATGVVLTAPPNPRAIEPRKLAAELGDPQVVVEPEIEEALDRALGLQSEQTVVVCGSVFLVGAVRGELRRRFGVPPDAAGSVYLPYESSETAG